MCGPTAEPSSIDATCPECKDLHTAGLRLLGADQSSAILAAVEHRLSEKYPVSPFEKVPVVIMYESYEVVFA